MAEKRCYYEVLGVQTTASDREIAGAYRKLAIKFHPDSHPGDEEATSKFKEAAEAYEVLSDGEKRGRYDQFGHAGVNGQAGSYQSVDDILDAFGDMFSGGVFGDLFGGGGRRGGRRIRRGADVRCDVTLDLEEAASGVSKQVSFRRSKVCGTCKATGAKPGSSKETCRRCGGRGQLVQSAGILRVQTRCPSCEGAGAVITDPCGDCRGSGYTSSRVTLDVRIPPGVDSGNRVRVAGEGEPSPDGGPPGDCYCFITVREHHLFHRDGQQLILQLPISYSQAALGAQIEVPTLDGPEDLKVPGGSQTGDVFRLRGHGMPDPHGGSRGDLLVQTVIEVPKKLSKPQRELLEQLAELEHVDVTPNRKSFLEKIKDYFTGEATSDG